MLTENQLEANRRNALRSTGPRTARGKAHTARNATRHGLNSRELLLPGEDAQQFARLQRGVRTELRPQGEVESFLAQRAAAGMWRLNRLLRVEAHLFGEPEVPALVKGEGPGAVFRCETQLNANAFATLLRYETEIERGVYRALHEIERRQATRAGNHLPPPLAVQLTVSEAGEL